jgi:isopentenyl diphosphate isomerase/L-lactate dehydrogenase-like FMN-dependent dehydrogenase
MLAALTVGRHPEAPMRIPLPRRTPTAPRADSYAEVEDAARRRLPRPLFDRMMGGVGRGSTARRNIAAFDDILFAARAGVGHEDRDLSTTVLGVRVELPVLLAPVGGVRLVNPAGAPAAARAAEAAGTLCAISMLSGHSLTAAAEGDVSRRWQQLYLSHGRARAEATVAEAARLGYGALVVTVDCPVPPRRLVPLRVSLPTALAYGPQLAARPRWLADFVRDGADLEAANAAMGARTNEATTWADVARVREQWPGPLVVKGVLRPDDARRAVDEGADAVVVSNHGGAVLDGLPPTIRMLPEVLAAVGDSVEVLLDGGVRQGTDAVKALALGARAVLIGRPWVAGLAAGGEAGVTAVLDMFRFQIDATLGLLGCPSVAALDRSYLHATFGGTPAGDPQPASMPPSTGSATPVM